MDDSVWKILLGFDVSSYKAHMTEAAQVEDLTHLCHTRAAFFIPSFFLWKVDWFLYLWILWCSQEIIYCLSGNKTIKSKIIPEWNRLGFILIKSFSDLFALLAGWCSVTLQKEITHLPIQQNKHDKICPAVPWWSSCLVLWDTYWHGVPLPNSTKLFPGWQNALDRLVAFPSPVANSCSSLPLE